MSARLPLLLMMLLMGCTPPPVKNTAQKCRVLFGLARTTADSLRIAQGSHDWLVWVSGEDDACAEYLLPPATP